MKRIYIADDEENICRLIQSFLENEGYQTEIFADGETLLERFAQQAPDMVILDVMMPGIDGFNVCASIRQTSQVPIIIVSAKDGALDRIKGINLGSDDYMVKPFLPMELVARVRALFRRAEMTQSHSAGDPLLAFGDLTINRSMHLVFSDKREMPVTPTEYEFLQYMMERCGMAISKKELLKEIWKIEDYEMTTRIADDMVKRLRRKLKETGSRVMVESVWGYGFRLSVVPEKAAL